MLNKLHKIANNEDWLISPKDRALMIKYIEQASMDGDPMFVVPEMKINGDVAIIPIKGTIVSGVGFSERQPGFCQLEDLESDIVIAINNTEVRHIVYDVNSPGGMYRGTPDVAVLIEKYAGVKPSYAFNSGVMASGAYWLCSGLRIISKSSAETGSIGAYSVWYDTSKAMEAQGVGVKVFTSGAYKGMTPEVSLTEDQDTYMQSRAMKMGNEFYSHVKEARAGVNESAFDGRTFQAVEAMELGLVDGLARNVEEVISIMKIEEQMAELVQKVDQLAAKNQELEANISALSDLITEADANKPEPKAQGSLTAEEVEKLVAKAASANAVDHDKLAGIIASKMIASTGQPGPIPGNTGKTLTAQERTEAHFTKVARQMKGIE
jgi:ClpP class serine protease